MDESPETFENVFLIHINMCKKINPVKMSTDWNKNGKFSLNIHMGIYINKKANLICFSL